MSAFEEEYAIQVVKVKDDHTYKLDEAALKQILLRDDVKDLPVVVMSVAGAYRGGKSFLLNFFLKYLKASESERNSRNWLGPESSPLGGFRWRGGCDRETTGMHLWSEPIKIEWNGEKVAVLLMDTQGTFDSSSTVRDCSTIFALSTLLSSVQIYNLKENIKEDDLQHLHLFTEYGKLAQDQEEKAFQALVFLVRDWPYPYQHSFGNVGGEQLLTKRLEINTSHTEEMRNLRDSIRACFNHVTAFLMPHPGFEVSTLEFTGSLSTIRKEFKEALLEMPALFKSIMTPKMINGHRVKCRDLVDFFRSYMNTFNSNELPEPVTIMKATSAAALMSAERDARESYEHAMESIRDPQQPSIPVNELHQAHNEALQSARKSFTSRKKMGPQKDIDDYLEKMMADLEAHLPSYETLNDAKMKSACAKVNQVYDDTILEACGGKILCLHPYDLDVLHVKAVTKALELLNTLRKSKDPDNDDESNALVQKLEDNIKELSSKNEGNNMSAVMKAQEHYVAQMNKSKEAGAIFSEEMLQQRHEEARQSAIQKFKSRRNMDTNEPNDIYLDMLQKNISDQYSKNVMINKNANKTAVQAALHTYNDFVSKTWSPQVLCLHPRDLAAVHENAERAALEEFTSNRISADNDEDVHREKLIESLERRYKELKNLNDVCNVRAVDEAYNYYCRKMESKCKPSLLTLLIVPWVVKVAKNFPEFHETYKTEALNLFKSRRRSLQYYGSDEYLDNLETKLNDGYDLYCNPLRALAREVGIEI